MKKMPQQSRSAGVRLQLVVNHQIRGHEEASSRDVVQNDEDARRHQNGKCCQPHARGNEPCPGGDRQTHHAHPFDAEIERGGDEVQCPQ